jgi:hypothetical protein
VKKAGSHTRLSMKARAVKSWKTRINNLVDHFAVNTGNKQGSTRALKTAHDPMSRHASEAEFSSIGNQATSLASNTALRSDNLKTSIR